MRTFAQKAVKVASGLSLLVGLAVVMSCSKEKDDLGSRIKGKWAITHVQLQKNDIWNEWPGGKASIGGMTASLICKVNPEAPKSSTEAIRMLRECQWKMDVEPGDYKDVFYDEVRYEFTEDAHFCRIFHVRSDLSSKHEYYKWRGEYVGYEHKVHCQITPESSDPTRGKIVVDEIFVGNGSFVAPVHIRFSKLNQAGWYMVRGEWKNTHDGAEIVWPDTGVNMVRTKERVSFIVLGYEEVE